MSARNVTFGNFNFTRANGVYLGPIKELSGPERAMTALDRAGRRGTTVVRAIMRGKVIRVTGFLLGDTEADFSQRFQAMQQALFAEHIVQSTPVSNLVIQVSTGNYIYDDCILINPDTVFQDTETWHGGKIVPFEALFLSPEGICHSDTETTETVSNIATSPYTDTITIDGVAAPDVLLAFEFDTVSTISEVQFTNTTTNEMITISGLDLTAGDILYVNTKTGEVLQNTTPVDYEGVFPTFLPGDNDYQIAFAGDSNIVESQTSYDAEVAVYGNNQMSQSFQVDSGMNITQLALFLKKVTGEALQLYDDFSGGSIDSDYWATSGTVDVSSGQMRLRGNNGASGETSISSTDNKTIPSPAGDPISGELKFYMAHSGGTHGGGGTCRVRLTNGTDYIEVSVLMDVNDMIIRLGGTYGSGDGARWTASSGTIDIVQEGSDIKIYHNGSLKQTITGKTIASNSYMHCTMATGSPGATNHYLLVDNVYIEGAANSNSDLDVEIQTDNTGEPSGTPVANGTLSISAASVGASFSEILAAFAAAVALSGSTTYHIVVSQTGGDTLNYYAVRKNTTGGYPDGQLLISTDGGSSWSAVTGHDVYFKLWTDLPSAYDVNFSASYCPAYFSAI